MNELPTRNHILHVIRNLLQVLKHIAKHCMQCHGECPMLIELSQADSKLKQILTDHILTL